MKDRTPISTTALVLAGGRATRMGGEDKGLLDCGGKTLIGQVLARVAPCVEEVLISANRNLATYRRYGYPVLIDATGDFPGPLAGIAQGLEHCTTEWLWVVPCDAPQIDVQLLGRLRQAARGANAVGAVPLLGDLPEPTFALVHRSVAPTLLSHLESGQGSVRDWLRSLPAVEVVCDDHPEWFININSREELAACIARLPAGRCG